MNVRHMIAVSGVALSVEGCAALNAIKPVVHNVNEVAQALCAAYQAAKTNTTPDDPNVVKFCAIEQNFGPFISIVTARQQDARLGVPLKTAALPEHCVKPMPAPSSSANPLPTAPSAKRPLPSRPAPEPKK